MATVEKESELDFYLKFAKPLVFNLPQYNERVAAASWIQKIRDPESGEKKLRTDYLKILLCILQRKELIGPFVKPPKEGQLEDFTDDLKNVQDVVKYFLNAASKTKKFPDITTEFSSDLQQYAALQEITNFGIHAFYAISNEPIITWHQPETGVPPTGSKSLHSPVQSAMPPSSRSSPTIGERLMQQLTMNDPDNLRKSLGIGDLPSPSWGSNSRKVQQTINWEIMMEKEKEDAITEDGDTDRRKSIRMARSPSPERDPRVNRWAWLNEDLVDFTKVEGEPDVPYQDPRLFAGPRHRADIPDKYKMEDFGLENDAIKEWMPADQFMAGRYDVKEEDPIPVEEMKEDDWKSAGDILAIEEKFMMFGGEGEKRSMKAQGPPVDFGPELDFASNAFDFQAEFGQPQEEEWGQMNNMDFYGEIGFNPEPPVQEIKQIEIINEITPQPEEEWGQMNNMNFYDEIGFNQEQAPVQEVHEIEIQKKLSTARGTEDEQWGQAAGMFDAPGRRKSIRMARSPSPQRDVKVNKWAWLDEDLVDFTITPPKKGAAKKGTPIRRTPQRGTPARGTPQRPIAPRGTPQRGTPQRANAPRGTPQRGTPQRANAPRRTPQRGTPQRGTPQSGTSQITVTKKVIHKDPELFSGGPRKKTIITKEYKMKDFGLEDGTIKEWMPADQFMTGRYDVKEEDPVPFDEMKEDEWKSAGDVLALEEKFMMFGNEGGKRSEKDQGAPVDFGPELDFASNAFDFGAEFGQPQDEEWGQMNNMDFYNEIGFNAEEATQAHDIQEFQVIDFSPRKSDEHGGRKSPSSIKTLTIEKTTPVKSSSSRRSSPSREMSAYTPPSGRMYAKSSPRSPGKLDSSIIAQSPNLKEMSAYTPPSGRRYASPRAYTNEIEIQKVVSPANGMEDEQWEQAAAMFDAPGLPPRQSQGSEGRRKSIRMARSPSPQRDVKVNKWAWLDEDLVDFTITPTKKGAAKKGTPVRGTPRKGTPARGTPQRPIAPRGTPQRGTPQRGTPQRGTSQRGTPQRANAPRGTPQRGTPQRGNSQITVTKKVIHKDPELFSGGPRKKTIITKEYKMKDFGLEDDAIKEWMPADQFMTGRYDVKEEDPVPFEEMKEDEWKSAGDVLALEEKFMMFGNEGGKRSEKDQGAPVDFGPELDFASNAFDFGAEFGQPQDEEWGQMNNMNFYNEIGFNPGKTTPVKLSPSRQSSPSREMSAYTPPSGRMYAKSPPRSPRQLDSSIIAQSPNLNEMSAYTPPSGRRYVSSRRDDYDETIYSPGRLDRGMLESSVEYAEDSDSGSDDEYIMVFERPLSPYSPRATPPPRMLNERLIGDEIYETPPEALNRPIIDRRRGRSRSRGRRSRSPRLSVHSIPSWLYDEDDISSRDSSVFGNVLSPTGSPRRNGEKSWEWLNQKRRRYQGDPRLFHGPTLRRNLLREFQAAEFGIDDTGIEWMPAPGIVEADLPEYVSEINQAEIEGINQLCNEWDGPAEDWGDTRSLSGRGYDSSGHSVPGWLFTSRAGTPEVGWGSTRSIHTPIDLAEMSAYTPPSGRRYVSPRMDDYDETIYSPGRLDRGMLDSSVEYAEDSDSGSDDEYIMVFERPLSPYSPRATTPSRMLNERLIGDEIYETPPEALNRPIIDRRRGRSRSRGRRSRSPRLSVHSIPSWLYDEDDISSRDSSVFGNVLSPTGSPRRNGEKSWEWLNQKRRRYRGDPRLFHGPTQRRNLSREFQAAEFGVDDAGIEWMPAPGIVEADLAEYVPEINEAEIEGINQLHDEWEEPREDWDDDWGDTEGNFVADEGWLETRSLQDFEERLERIDDFSFRRSC